ncbi:HipA domain-containing protein [Filimonas effusa]|uniref:Type II toxin-antitoxin system HipA family toxin n=1 Tax=Filimonas effusa TaxID=2508721 RepID=A0A4Q1D7H2_9BACT|nr:HipA domain-containing protein [Filimonas effusa]RXK83647.1 type II toxin-antitoxin system HipA family toxin [Filimonas effusa]
MSKHCLYCYQPLAEDSGNDFHERCSLTFFGDKVPPRLSYTLDQMAELAKNIVERRIAVPGVQPKLSLTLVKEVLEDGAKGRLTIVNALGGNYIFKPPHQDYDQMPENEHVTMRIAEEVFGLKTVPSSLIRLQSGELSYITKRIDRTASNEKIHMLDMFQVLEARDKYKGSHERIGKAIEKYSVNTLLDQTEYFRLVLFCFLTGNTDMHLKNFSLIQGEDGWGLSPAYDLLNVTLVFEDEDDLALTIGGKRRKLLQQHLSDLASGLGLNSRQISATYKMFSQNKPLALEWLDRSFLSDQKKEAYKVKINERYARLGL